jgi:hypothetical protein
MAEWTAFEKVARSVATKGNETVEHWADWMAVATAYPTAASSVVMKDTLWAALSVESTVVMTAAQKVDLKAAVKDTRSVAETVVLRAVYSAFWRADLSVAWWAGDWAVLLAVWLAVLKVAKWVVSMADLMADCWVAVKADSTDLQWAGSLVARRVGNLVCLSAGTMAGMLVE